MVQVLVDLVGVTVLSQQTTKNTSAAHPQNFERHTGLGGTPSFTVASVSAFALGFQAAVDATAGVDDGWFIDNEAVLDQLADILARVGHADLGVLVRVQPDLSFPALHDGRRQALL